MRQREHVSNQEGPRLCAVFHHVSRVGGRPSYPSGYGTKGGQKMCHWGGNKFTQRPEDVPKMLPAAGVDGADSGRPDSPLSQSNLGSKCDHGLNSVKIGYEQKLLQLDCKQNAIQVGCGKNSLQVGNGQNSLPLGYGQNSLQVGYG